VSLEMNRAKRPVEYFLANQDKTCYFSLKSGRANYKGRPTSA